MNSYMLFVLVFFSFFEKTTYCCRARRLSVRPSVEIISFLGNSLSNRPIDLKIGLNVREGVVHVRKAWFFEIRTASCKFFDIAVFPDNEPFVFQLILQLVAKRIVHSEQQVEQDNPREIRFLYTMITMQCTLFFLI